MAETVCQCPVCLDQLKDPKLLPCLHRYCKDCLTSVIQSPSERMFKCSVCKQDCEIPENGVDGFKTDLHMVNRLLLIKLQDSVVKNHQNQLCGICSEESTTQGYCFKCDKSLCQQCYQIHLTTGEFQDHQPHILNLETIKEKNLTSETISPFTVDPICAVHVTNRARLVCSTCGGVPICVTCVTGRHKGHELLDVVELAEIERQLLEEKLLGITKHVKKLNEIPTNVRSTAQLTTISPKLQAQCELTENNITRESILREIETERQKELTALDQKFKKKSKEAREKYDKIEATCHSKLENIENNVLEQPATEHIENELQVIFDNCKQLIERYKNVKATSSYILASKEIWSDYYCIPYIRTAIASLGESMEQAITQVRQKPILNGTFKCHASKCIVCENNILASNNFTNYNGTQLYDTKGYITCTSTNVVYLISCQRCKSKYVGKTEQELKERFSKHKSNVSTQNAPNTITEHFNSRNHSVDDMKLQGITSLTSPEELRAVESEWIHTLNTLVQHGLNVQA